MAAITPAEAHAYFKRWELAEKIELIELRRTSMQVKLRMKWLDSSNIPSMVIGGVAASVLGQPRLTQAGIDIDVKFGGLLFEQAAIDNSEIHDIGGLRVRLPRVEDLLMMKAVARHPKDLQVNKLVARSRSKP